MNENPTFPAETEDDADILFPDREIEIGGEEITVRELTYLQGLRMGPRLAPLLRELESAIEDPLKADLFGIEAAFATHPELFSEAVSAATGQPAEWIEGLSDQDGYGLMVTFWTVNMGFFVRRLAAQKFARKQTEEMEEPATPESAPSSPGS